ncbi:MAG: hypothetical protein D6722_12215 [Bacteroidetes bacterium]|nr:MAG: hypothetical protein D6722_12215 [Bacteroidota bacterium]
MRGGSKSFATKNGSCHLYPDRIEIENHDLAGRLGAFLYRRGFRRAWVLYLLLALGMALAAASSYLIDNMFLAAFFAILVPVALIGLWTQRSVTYAPVIPRKEIESVVYRPAVKGVSRATFIIFFRPRKRLMQRLIPLPGITQQGTSLADTAYWMMREEGLVE